MDEYTKSIEYNRIRIEKNEKMEKNKSIKIEEKVDMIKT